jgi:uncharacterized membrane protein
LTPEALGFTIEFWVFTLQEAAETMPANSKSFLGRLFRRAVQMFHILVGVVFLFLTVGMVSVSLKLWQEYQKMPEQSTLNFAIVVVSVAFSFVLFIFCLYTFVKARSVR